MKKWVSYGRIRSQRNLEDFARLWISGLPALPPSQGYSVTLSFAPYQGEPAINLYRAYDTNGGSAYLTDTNAAAAQFTQAFLNGTLVFDYAQKVGTVDSTHTYTMSMNTDGTAQFTKFLFEGAGIGSGELILTISKDSIPIATTSMFFDLRDVKEMYEQAHVENVFDTTPSTATATFKSDRALGNNTAEEKQLIVFVHGWRMGQWDYENFSQSMFKRLYWQGYHGRFASLRWPTLSQDDFKFFSDTRSYLTYNKSEFRAFQSGTAMGSYLNWLKERLPDYSINVAAHSMGNIVMMEALKQQAANNILVVNNYVLMQAAVPAHCYDTNLANYPIFMTKEADVPTPDRYRGYPGAITNAVQGNIVNFFNTNDFALVSGTLPVIGSVSWEGNEIRYKPDVDLGYDANATNGLRQDFVLPNVYHVLTDAREIIAFCARPRSKAVGGISGVGGMIKTGQVDLKANFGFNNGTDEHSAQFNWNIQRVDPFYRTLLLNLQILPRP